jgi:hypothetical protein
MIVGGGTSLATLQLRLLHPSAQSACAHALADQPLPLRGDPEDFEVDKQHHLWKEEFAFVECLESQTDHKRNVEADGGGVDAIGDGHWVGALVGAGRLGMEARILDEGFGTFVADTRQRRGGGGDGRSRAHGGLGVLEVDGPLVDEPRGRADNQRHALRRKGIIAYDL